MNESLRDRLLSRRPVLLLLLGSDLHMMERLTAYDRPFFGRADNLLFGPLNPAEVGDALGLRAADAIDACLLSGGLPGILRAWPEGLPALGFAEGEWEAASARVPISAEAGSRAGAIPSGTLTPVLHRLVEDKHGGLCKTLLEKVEPGCCAE